MCDQQVGVAAVKTHHTLSRSAVCWLGLPLTSSLLLEYSSEYLNEYSSTR